MLHTATPRAGTVPAVRDMDLSSVARLEVGLAALADRDVPVAVAALAAIPEADWQAILTRFPTLADYIAAQVSP